MTQAQDLAALGNYGTPQDYYDATGQSYAPVNPNDPNFNGGTTLVDSQGRPWSGQGEPYLMVDAQHATAQYPVGSLVAYNSPDRQAVYRDMPQTGLLGDLKTVAPALLGAAGGIAGGLAGLGGAAEAGVGAGSGIGGGAGGAIASPGIWGGAIDSANALGMGTAAAGGAGASVLANNPIANAGINAAGATNSTLGAATAGTGAASQLLDESAGLNTSAVGGPDAQMPTVSNPTPGVTPSTVAGGATAASALSKLISGQDMTADDWAKLGIGAAGVAIPAIGGAISADKTADTIKGIYDTQRADRAPALAAYNNALANPDTFYNSAPATGALNGVLAKLSAQGGNPANNPGALSQAAAYNLGGYSNYLSGLAGPAFGGQATQAQLGSNLANAQGSQYAGVGYGLGTLLGNQSQPQYGLTIGGMRF